MHSKAVFSPAGPLLSPEDPWYGPVARFLQLEEHQLLYAVIAVVVSWESLL